MTKEYDMYRRVVEIREEDIPKDLIEKLKILNGVPPHNTMANIAWGDGYFAKSLEAKYGKDMISAAYMLVIGPLQQKISDAIEAITKEHLNE